MGFFRGLFDGTYRRARRAEGEGDYRAAAALYAEVGAEEEAANALLFLAARADDLSGRLDALRDALRFLPEGHPRRGAVSARLGRALLDGVSGGPVTDKDRARLRDAGRHLVEAGKHGEAATAWLRLGEVDEAARCLERGGEVERLEELLEAQARGEDRERRLLGLLKDHEVGMATGDRVAAREALRAALDVSPDDPAVAALFRDLESRWLPPGRVTIRVGQDTFHALGLFPVRLGRADADLPFRGASVSRLHAQIDLQDGRFVLSDLGSRNGTLVSGVPLAGPLRLEGEVRVGLGSDVLLRLCPGDDQLDLSVEAGVDRGLRAAMAPGPVRLPGLPAVLTFPDGQPTLSGAGDLPVSLSGKPVRGAVVLLSGDRLTVGDTPLEVG